MRNASKLTGGGGEAAKAKQRGDDALQLEHEVHSSGASLKHHDSFKYIDFYFRVWEINMYVCMHIYIEVSIHLYAIYRKC